MKPAAHYKGREQTYLKHYALEQYLERVAYNIGSFAHEFVYVDGFSGPWRATDDAYEDTSFVIATNKLRSVRDALSERGREFKVRCVFVERNPESFAALREVADKIDDFEIQLINGAFEDHVADIASRIGSAFALVFIDPTGWSGYALQKIRPILQKKCEVLINFMFNDINRHIDDPREAVTSTFSELLGGPSFVLDDERPREPQIIEQYVKRLAEVGGFAHTTYTRILKPEQERTYFHLAYGTGHPKGLLEFRRVEKKLFDEQARVRREAKQATRIGRTGQQELFPAAELEEWSVLDTLRSEALYQAKDWISEKIQTSGSVLFDDLLFEAIRRPFVWESDVKETLQALKKAGRIEYQGMSPKERVPKHGRRHRVVATPIG